MQHTMQMADEATTAVRTYDTYDATDAYVPYVGRMSVLTVEGCMELLKH